METRFKRLLSLRNIALVGLSFWSFFFQNGLAGCDSGPSAKESASTSTGTSVDISHGTPANPSANEPPPDGTKPTTSSNQSPATNIILIVGSGMGPQQIGEVIQYRRLRQPDHEKLALEKLMDKKTMGLMTTESYLDLVSDTSSANTAMACGLKSRNNTVGLDANGNPCDSILEKAAKLGKGTGLVSNAKVSDGGVAAYLAHQLNSEDENEIAADIFSQKNVDVILAGGIENLIPQFKGGTGTSSSMKSIQAPLIAANFHVSPELTLRPQFPIGTLQPEATPVAPPNPTPEGSAMSLSDIGECAGTDAAVNGPSRRKDQQNLVEQAKGNGYQFVCKKDQLASVSPGDQTKLVGIFSANDFPLSPERKGLASLPSLADMTSKALEILDKKPKGFLLVIEGGLTRVAAQDNDPGTLLQEGIDFDAALKVALDYADKNPNTLLIVTADHDTAGFGFAYSKQPGSEVKLPSGDQYDAPYNYAPSTRYDLLMGQKKSFHGMTEEIVEKLYDYSPAISLDEGAAMLVDEIKNNSSYKVSLDQAKQVLWRAPGDDTAETKDFSKFYVHGDGHTNLLGRAVSPQTSTVWNSGTSTSTPVMVLASGPSQYAERVRGLITNSDIGKIISDALNGK